ncbi:MAG: alpha/beta hydrolase family protein, partial [Verrucomicrobiota bacterium]
MNLSATEIQGSTPALGRCWTRLASNGWAARDTIKPSENSTPPKFSARARKTTPGAGVLPLQLRNSGLTALLLASTLCLSQAQLKETSQENPDMVSDSRTLSRRVLPLADSGGLLEKYFARRSQEKAAAIHAKNPPAKFLESQSQLRLALEETFLMPPASGKPQATFLGSAVLDGIQVEKQLLKIRDGVYSPALVWRPAQDAVTQKAPAILMLPGHGEPSWSPAVQSRCLSFAKRGYVVMLVQPFGQSERGEKVKWNEGHDTQATAFLLTVGQSMLGLIMSDHRAELDYLAARPDVDAQKLG